MDLLERLARALCASDWESQGDDPAKAVRVADGFFEHAKENGNEADCDDYRRLAKVAMDFCTQHYT